MINAAVFYQIEYNEILTATTGLCLRHMYQIIEFDCWTHIHITVELIFVYFYIYFN